MNQQRLLFEYHPLFLLLCVGLGIAYAYILYKAKNPWSIVINRVLFALRAGLVFLLAVLILGPILKLTHNVTEKPTMVFLVDNSISVKEMVDSAGRTRITADIDNTSKKLKELGFDVSVRDLGEGRDGAVRYNTPTSDLAGALRNIVAENEGRNLAGIVLLSDGIYNSGSSPLYMPLRIPVFTVGLGDTTVRTDLSVKNLAFNKIAYQGNKFPLRAEIAADGVPNQDISVSVYQSGKLVTRQTKNSGQKNLLDFDFQLDAAEKGLQRVDVVVESQTVEKNKKNNKATAFIEVVEGRKKILVIAPAPHPDIKALRSVIEKNSNYEFILHIPGIQEASPAILIPGRADLVIFHQVLDLQGKTTALFTSLSQGRSSMLIMIGTGSNLRGFQAAQLPISFEKTGQWDEATPLINASFRDFGFTENSNLNFSKYPPASVPFGKFSFPGNASILLYQQIGSVNTDRPMLLTYDENSRKIGVLVAEGIWRWRLNEFAETEKTDAFDEVFSKLIQYLSTLEDKRKFRSFPVQNEFTDSEQITFESQVYNDLFQQVYGNNIQITLRDEQGKTTSYNYVTSAGNLRYRIGGLKEGVYRYVASTPLNGRREEVKGEFIVKSQNIESQNLTADFGLLRKLSASTGAKFYGGATGLQSLDKDVMRLNAKGLIHSEESFNPLINLPWLFFALLTLISTEWFLRKYLGAY